MSNKPQYDATSEDDPMVSGDIMAENIYACEQQQKSLKNPLFNVTATAQKLESAVRDF